MRLRATTSISLWTSNAADERVGTRCSQPGGEAAMTAPRSDDGVLFVPYRETLALLSVEDALAVCEQVISCMRAAAWSVEPCQASSSTWADGFHNHWHVKSVLLEGCPAHRRAPLQLLRRRRAQHGRRPSTARATSCSPIPIAATRRSLSWTSIWSYASPQRRGGRHRLQMGGAENRRCWGSWASAPWAPTPCAACSAMYGSTRSAAPRAARRRGEAFAERWSKELGIPCSARIPSRRSCAAPTSRSAARPRRTS